ncbi:hypothetical protein BASA61_004883 [Batrachochytrium salamandrivorans]|nr:hypothetical protein BASA61_004883 [Batrachochytrium salamandrivorans]
MKLDKSTLAHPTFCGFYEVTGTVSNKGVGVACHHEIKRHIEDNGRFNIWRYPLSIGTCMRHRLFLPVAMPCGTMFVSKEECNAIYQTKIVQADDDQVTVVMSRLDEASQISLQSLSNSELATKRGSSQQGSQSASKSNEKSHSLST